VKNEINQDGLILLSDLPIDSLIQLLRRISSQSVNQPLFDMLKIGPMLTQSNQRREALLLRSLKAYFPK
jgi:hypothetical protein